MPAQVEPRYSAVLVNAIYLNVRETLLSQVLEHKESNPGLSSYLEVLAKKVLDTVSLFPP